MRRLLLMLMLFSFGAQAQVLKIKPRQKNALGGAAFAKSISDTSISFEEREKRIYKEVISGNIPQAYRNLAPVIDTIVVGYAKIILVKYYVLPDYLAIGSDSDYFYCPLTPGMAQRIANKLKCTLPTKQLVDRIYQQAAIKLEPQPIPPSPAMTTVPVFMRHNQMVIHQRDSIYGNHKAGKLVAGNKKDVIISNKIYNDTSDFHVVIYGWHRLNGKAIQPVYAKHLSNWADYSHGIRLIQNKLWINGEETTWKKVLRSEGPDTSFSDEGAIRKPFYPDKTRYQQE
jgi:hypothetical protein